jgi:glycosyltransferase involved in cell wall biosynthesis
VRAFSSFLTTTPDAHLVVLGRGDPSGLRALVRELELDHRVTLLEARRDVPDVLAAFDVFIHPALAESFGLAVIEAMAMSLPTVATPVGIARDVIEDGVSGIRIRGNDEMALIDAMSRVIECRDRWQALGTEARRRALAFTPERWVRTHERLYARRLGAPLNGRAGAR